MKIEQMPKKELRVKARRLFLKELYDAEYRYELYLGRELRPKEELSVFIQLVRRKLDLSPLPQLLTNNMKRPKNKKGPKK